MAKRSGNYTSCLRPFTLLLILTPIILSPSRPSRARTTILISWSKRARRETIPGQRMVLWLMFRKLIRPWRQTATRGLKRRIILSLEVPLKRRSQITSMSPCWLRLFIRPGMMRSMTWRLLAVGATDQKPQLLQPFKDTNVASAGETLEKKEHGKIIS